MEARSWRGSPCIDSIVCSILCAGHSQRCEIGTGINERWGRFETRRADALDKSDHAHGDHALIQMFTNAWGISEPRITELDLGVAALLALLCAAAL